MLNFRQVWGGGGPDAEKQNPYEVIFFYHTINRPSNFITNTLEAFLRKIFNFVFFGSIHL